MIKSEACNLPKDRANLQQYTNITNESVLKLWKYCSKTEFLLVNSFKTKT